MWEEYLKTLNNRESYISITVGFFAVLVVGIFLYNYFSDKIQRDSLVKKETTQTINERKEIASPKTYTVRKDEYLWDIAVKFYGDGFAWIKIANANNLSDPNTIHVGNRLIIPR